MLSVLFWTIAIWSHFQVFCQLAFAVVFALSNHKVEEIKVSNLRSILANIGLIGVIVTWAWVIVL